MVPRGGGQQSPLRPRPDTCSGGREGDGRGNCHSACRFHSCLADMKPFEKRPFCTAVRVFLHGCEYGICIVGGMHACMRGTGFIRKSFETLLVSLGVVFSGFSCRPWLGTSPHGRFRFKSTIAATLRLHLILTSMISQELRGKRGQ